MYLNATCTLYYTQHLGNLTNLTKQRSKLLGKVGGLPCIGCSIYAQI